MRVLNKYEVLYAQGLKNIKSDYAYIIGGGLAGLAAAAFLVLDAGMPGENITILEKDSVVGGSMDAESNAGNYLCRGEREIDPKMHCIWDLYDRVPSLQNPTISVLEEILEFNMEQPIFSKYRVIHNQGQLWDKIHDFKLSDKDRRALFDLLRAPDEENENKRIDEVFSPEFFEGGFWVCFHSILAFKKYHAAIELKRYILHYPIMERLDYLEGMIHTELNEYESLILPLKNLIEKRGVKISNNKTVSEIELSADNNTATAIKYLENGAEKRIDLKPTDLVFFTNGSITESSAFGNNTMVAKTIDKLDENSLFNIWRKLAARDSKFGNPDNFLNRVAETNWISFFQTIKDYPLFFDRLEKISGSKAGTGGAVTIVDSNWDMSFELHHVPFFSNQSKNEQNLFGYANYSEKDGNYVKKPMRDCTGAEILTELLYHLDMLDIRDELLAHSYISTCMMPYINSQFLPRKVSDRPRCVPEGCTNIGFLGQFVEIPEEATFTIELSVRSAMQAVYQLAGVQKELPPVTAPLSHKELLKIMKRFYGKS